MQRIFSLLLIGFAWVGNVWAQPELKSPSEFLGYELGSRYTPHHRIVDYFQYMSSSQGKYVRLKQYGTTSELRPLYVAIVGNSDVMSRLESVRKDNLKRAGVLEGALENPEDSTAIVWMSYNVHGNEGSPSETAMLTLYKLVKAFHSPENGEEFKSYQNALVIIDPCLNPDGRDRYVNWVSQKLNMPANPDLDASEHHEPWPGGRVNHYMFDLNRDWAWQTQVESSTRMKEYNQWLPHVHVDFHEQFINSPYYFAPSAEPIHQVVSKWQMEFQKIVGQANAREFDSNRWLYFTRQSFDLFYPSYGDTYPTFNGAVGMTFEQAGHTQSGTAVITNTGDTLTLKDRIAHHLTSGLSTVRASAENSGRLVGEFEKYFLNSAKAPEGKYRTYIVSSKNNPDKLNKLMNFLDQQGIVYGQPLARRSVRAFDYDLQKDVTVNLSAKDLVISVFQPKSRLLKVLFEPKTYLSDSVTYDITAWAMPYAYGLKTYASSNKVYVSRQKPVYKKQLETVSSEEPYAYLLRWESIKDARFLAELFKKGFKVRFAAKPFGVDGQDFGRGTLIITQTNNQRFKGKFGRILTQMAEEHGQELVPASSGFVSYGVDFGSHDVHLMSRPKIALVSGDGVNPNRFGEAWFYFEKQLGYPVTVLETDYLQQVDLSKYSVLVLPEGNYGDFLSKNGKAKLHEWVAGGGKLIAIGKAAQSLKDSKGFGLKTYYDSNEEKEMKSLRKKFAKEDLLASYEGAERRAISSYNPGAIYRVHLDNTHPLAYGYGSVYYTIKTSGTRYAYLQKGHNVGTIRSKKDLVSGFVGERLQPELIETLAFGVEPIGRGCAVYFADSPIFRSFWENGKLLFSNALFFVNE
ncbi:MAG: M14 family metallopeptidase [Cytophagales bacterium]|nr:M14 family metallopeptidase [Cytophagales bacterium]